MHSSASTLQPGVLEAFSPRQCDIIPQPFAKLCPKDSVKQLSVGRDERGALQICLRCALFGWPLYITLHTCCGKYVLVVAFKANLLWEIMRDDCLLKRDIPLVNFI